MEVRVEKYIVIPLDLGRTTTQVKLYVANHAAVVLNSTKYTH
jgi:hypothetical protein